MRCADTGLRRARTLTVATQASSTASSAWRARRASSPSGAATWPTCSGALPSGVSLPTLTYPTLLARRYLLARQPGRRPQARAPRSAKPALRGGTACSGMPRAAHSLYMPCVRSPQHIVPFAFHLRAHALVHVLESGLPRAMSTVTQAGLASGIACGGSSILSEQTVYRQSQGSPPLARAQVFPDAGLQLCVQGQHQAPVPQGQRAHRLLALLRDQPGLRRAAAASPGPCARCAVCVTASKGP